MAKYNVYTTPTPATTTMSYIYYSTTIAATGGGGGAVSYTTPTPGAGSVEPMLTTPLALSDTGEDNNFGLSTQLIIWGMVGFILVELIAIGCLLRYCCRARYLRRRKYKEKEIILSDIPSNSLYSRQHNLDSSVANLISNSQLQLVPDNNKSRTLNETIMVDDIMSDYSGFKTRHGTHKSNLTLAADRMKREMSAEDIYTLKFSTNGQIEPQYDEAQGTRHHESYLYNGSMHRPAFEIVSHADERPATPIRFEHTRDLTHSDEEYIYNERPHYHKKKNSRRSRAHTQPIHLNHANIESVNNTGKPVEWQVARELRTTDWDQLKRTYAHDDNTVHSFRFSGASGHRESGSYLKNSRSSKSTSNLNSYYPPQEDRYQYRTEIGSSVTAAAAAASGASFNSHQSAQAAGHIGEESNRNSLYRNYLLDRRNSKQQIISGPPTSSKKKTTTSSSPQPSSSSSRHRVDMEPSAVAKQPTNYSFDPPPSSSRRQSSGRNATGLYGNGQQQQHTESESQYERERTRSQGDNRSESTYGAIGANGALLTRVVKDRDTDEILSMKQINDTINNSIEQQNNNIYNNYSNDNDHDITRNNNKNTNNNDNSHYTAYESPEEMGQETELDHSNISVIDITYQQQQQQRLASQNQQPHDLIEEEDDNNRYSPLPDLDAAPLPPPLPFVNHSDSIRTENKNDLTNVSALNSSDDYKKLSSKRSNASSTNYKRNDSEVDYDEEIFRQRDSEIQEVAEEIDEVSEFNRNRFSISHEQVVSNRSSLVKPDSVLGRTSETNNNGSMSEKATDLLSEIKLFNSGSLRPTSKTSYDQPLIYEKNMDLLKEGSRSSPSNSFLQQSRQGMSEEQASNASTQQPNANNQASLY